MTTTEITCDCTTVCGRDCPCMDVPCADDECGGVRGCLDGSCSCAGDGECD